MSVEIRGLLSEETVLTELYSIVEPQKIYDDRS